jgi:hypothetical protein
MHRGVFQSIEERYVKHMENWNGRLMSHATKEVMIKAVVQALPTYVMSIFKLPFGLCDSLKKHMQAFWWGSEPGHRKVRWLPWTTLMIPKSYGGLGFKDLCLFNQALLAHQAMRLMMYPNSLCARVLKAKYFLMGNLLDMASMSNASVMRIGDVESMRIWRDNWIPCPSGL